MTSRRSDKQSKFKSTAAQASASDQQNQSHASFPIVGIAASAGGLEAFTQLLQYLPTDTGMAFVLIQHLNPNHESLLAEILARTTQMPVREVLSGMTVEPNQVYVIPPNTKMTLAQGRLQLSPREKIHGKYMPADAFFHSLAAEQGNQALGVVLSGTDGDGAIGLEAIKAANGITFAQCETSAQFDGMPNTAVATGQVDLILPPEKIAEELAKISRHAYINRPAPATTVEDPLEGEDALTAMYAMLRTATRVDFTDYKQTTVKRRIERRMLLYKLERLEDYVRYLQDNPAEVNALYQELLISVTNFFRDPEAFEVLKQRVFGIITQGKSVESPIRIWVPGCATGEEVYSIAICLLEFLEGMTSKPSFQIFATDLSETAIDTARAGIYKHSQMADVSVERLRSFFVQVEGGYQISKAIRERCVFAKHNLIGDSPFSNLDLISCRNVMIYLGSTLQQKLIPVFHYSLKPTSFLLLGTSESVGEFSNLFALVDKKYKLYSRKLAPTRPSFDLVTSNHPISNIDSDKRVNQTTWSELDPEKEADRIVLNQYAPIGVLTNNEMDILQFRGDTSPYLRPAPGKASFNLLKMARAGLLPELRTAMHQAKRQDTLVRKEGLRVEGSDRPREVSVEVIPFKASPAGTHYFLVLFKDTSPAPGLPALEGQSSQAKSGRREQTNREFEIARLQQELAATQEYLQATIQEQEATNQDLRVANEEVLSSNEELQSTNEELETAKEEIQATNEELNTTNEELNSRNRELHRVNNDLSNLLGSVSIPILMLANDLCVRRFTPTAQRIFNLIPTDVGRSLSHIRSNINVPDLEALVLEVIDTLSIKELEVQDSEGRWYDLRIRPYRTTENQIDGAVIVLVDIDALKRSAAQLEAARNYAEAIVESVREPLIVLDDDLQVVTANRAFYQTFQASPPLTERRSIFELGNGQWNIPNLRSLLEDILLRNTQFQNFEVAQVFDPLGPRTMLLNARKISADGDGQMVLLAIEDITERKQAEEQIKTSLQEKEVLLREIHHRVKNNLQIISSLLSLQSNRIADPQASEILEDSLNRVRAMSLIHEILYQSSNFTEISFAEYAQNLIANLFNSYMLQPDLIALRVDMQPNIALNTDKAVLCGLIINELMTNALKHGFPEGRGGEIFVTLEAIPGNFLTLTVGNNGESLPAGIDLQNLQSMGLNLVMTLVQQLKGTLELDRSDRTLFKITFASSERN